MHTMIIVFCLLAMFLTKHFYALRKPKVKLPYMTIGCGPSWIRLWWTAIKYIGNAKYMIDTGYHEYKTKTGAFQIPTFSGEHIIVCSDKLVDEFRNAPPNVLSSHHDLTDILQTRFTIGADLFLEPYHVKPIREQLTRNLDRFTEAVEEEFAHSIHANLDSDNWKAIRVYDFCTGAIARGISRVFVGSDLCKQAAPVVHISQTK